MSIYLVAAIHSVVTTWKFTIKHIEQCIAFVLSRYQWNTNFTTHHSFYLVGTPDNEGPVLTHLGWVSHICASKLTSIVSDNGLSLGRRQAIIWTNAWILLIGPLGTNSSEIIIGIRTFWFNEMRLKMSSGKWLPFCLDLNVLIPSHIA